MRCPYCGQDEDKVIDSRTTDGARSTRRRRECLSCGKRFTTYEHVEKGSRVVVVKKDGARVPFDREKILAGVQKACYKRAVSAEVMAKLAEEVEEEVLGRGVGEVESIEIGRLTADRLKRVDAVAYVRFASVYKQFRDIDDLLDEVKDLLEKPGDDGGTDQGRLF